MKDALAKKTPRELVKGQFWRTSRGLVQIVELGNGLVYYRISTNPKVATFTRILKRDAFQQELDTTSATLLANGV